jgi:hypothetical protein
MKISPFTDLGNNLLKFQTFHRTSSTKKGIGKYLSKNPLGLENHFSKFCCLRRQFDGAFWSTNMVPQIANF